MLDKDYLQEINSRKPLYDSDFDSQTIKLQEETENIVLKAFNDHYKNWKELSTRLFKSCHTKYCMNRLFELPASMSAYHCSQPWIVYWLVHSLLLLGVEINQSLKEDIIAFLKSCQNESGGFGGGPKQISHLATTYAAVNCLASLQIEEALQIVDRSKLLSWLKSLKLPDGSFHLNRDGEIDVRGVYCAISICHLLRIEDPHLFLNTPEWISNCQTYEGGFGGSPSLEAHGGYTFCAVAGLKMLKSGHLIDLPRLLRWLSHRQMNIEGGFQGRTNKLVDCCYSFWQGSLFDLLNDLLQDAGDDLVSQGFVLMNEIALQEYIILACQKVPHFRPGLSVPIGFDNISSNVGGLIDKPGKNPDPYHTCYALSGLSIAQKFAKAKDPQLNDVTATSRYKDAFISENDNHLASIETTYNILKSAAKFCQTHFDKNKDY